MTMDRLKGKGKEVVGEGKERAGRATGDKDLEAEGRADKFEGKAQGVAGEAREALEDVKDEVKKKVS